ncbi:class I SAM-dependent methyltransferase [Streptomyces sp. SudanB25_2051]|uniref:class I SAM-dependent methyltransferase n=1 Tax=Streptomyces sp. SudanB25_2051 TaxID=3035275 RepID=UPI003F55FF26
MPSLLSNPLTRRLLRPAVSLVEQRMERITHAFQKDLDALHHEVADLRRQSYGLGLLLDEAGRGAHRMPTPTQVDRLVAEVATVTGEAGERARAEVTVAYRHLVALEALGAGGTGGTVSDVCGRLASVPLLVGARAGAAPSAGAVAGAAVGAPAGVGAGAGGSGATAGASADGASADGASAAGAVADGVRGGALATSGGVVEVLEVGARHGLFAAALRLMLRRHGVEARLTLAGALDEDAARENLALGGAGREDARLVRGGLDAPEVRERRYGVLILDAPREEARELAADGAVLVAPADGAPVPGLRPVGQVADSLYLAAP